MSKEHRRFLEDRNSGNPRTSRDKPVQRRG